MSSIVRTGAVACAILMVLLVFQSLGAEATKPNTGANEFNHALASNGGVATASGFYGSNTPGKANDGSTSTYWQSSTTTGWLAVAFARKASIDEVHLHFLTTKYPKLSLYYDTNGNGLYETGEKLWTTTSNGALDVIVPVATSASGIKVTIDEKAGNNKPKIAELEAYLRYDTDGDGLTNTQEAATVYGYNASAVDLPVAVPDGGTNNTTLTMNRLGGVPFRGLAEFIVDHARKEDLSASLSYWNGTAWVEEPVWDPGKRLTRPTITYPASGAEVYGNVQVTATVERPVLAKDVSFYLDGVWKASPSPVGNTYTWDWDTAGASPGLHTLRVTTLDVWDGTFSHEIGVATDATAPSVSIWSSSYSPCSGESVTISGRATDSGGLDFVDFMGTHIERNGETAWSGSGTASHFAPYGSGRTYRYSISAADLRGNSASAFVDVTWFNPCGESAGAEGAPSGQEAIEQGWPGEGTFLSPTSTLLAPYLGKWASDAGYYPSGSRHRVVVNLTRTMAGITPGETAARIRPLGLPSSILNDAQTWRLTIQDWASGIQGTITGFALRFEETSSPSLADTDGDGLSDYNEAAVRGTMPIARDTDADGLSDGFEVASHPLTLWRDGVSSVPPAFQTNPTAWDSDADGLADGQERGFVTTGQSKVIGEVGQLRGLGGTWTTVFLRNRYSAPVVIAEPATSRDRAFDHVRLRSVTDHTFEARVERWDGSSPTALEDITYLVLESGNHVLPDGTAVEAGTKTGVGATAVSVTFQEAFASAPLVLLQAQTAATAKGVVAKRTNAIAPASFGAYVNGNGSAVSAETIGYVAIAPQADVGVLASWSRTELAMSAKTGVWSFPANFSSTPLVLGWMASEASANNIGLRLTAVTNASASVVLEQKTSTSAYDSVDLFAFAGPVNLTARMTTDPNAADTDGDGLVDGTEVLAYGSNPTLKDTDADGLADNVEVTDRTMTIPVNGQARTITFRTSPVSDDTDADGVKDPDEIAGILPHRVLFYDMQTTRSGKLMDLSGNLGDGTIESASCSSNDGGKVGRACTFGGGSSRVSVPDSSNLDLTSQYTILAWVYPTTTSQANGAGIVTKGYGGGGEVYSVDIWNGYFRTYFWKGGVAYPVSWASAFAANTWYLVAATYDGPGRTLSVSVNAATPRTIASVPTSLDTNGHALSIGSRESSSTSGYTLGFVGRIDEVQIWDRALTQTEVSAYYNATSPGYLVASLDLETRTSAGGLFDFSGTGHSGVVAGTSVMEGRAGLALRFGGSDGISLSGTASVSFASGAAVSLYVLLSSYPPSDAPLVARKGSVYLNVTSHGRIQWTVAGVTPLATALPVPLNRWVRIAATAGSGGLALYVDGLLAASSSTSATPPSPSNPVTLGYADGIAPRFVGAMDEVLVFNAVPSSWTLSGLGVRGIVLNPNSTDTDGDGLADGQELYVQSAKTPKRYPIADLYWTNSDGMNLPLAAPGWALQSVTLMTGFTHPDMGQLQANLVHNAPAPWSRVSTLRSNANGGEANNFTSYDLLGFGYTREEFVAGGTWSASVYDRLVGNRGQIEYYQLQLAVHTRPDRADTDADGLNDFEELNLATDGFTTDPWKADTDGDGLADNEYFTKGTSPLLADTDRDGFADSADWVPLGDAFLTVTVLWATVYGGTDDDSTPSSLEPFVQVSVDGVSAYTDYHPVSPGYTATFNHAYSVNVRDDASYVDVYFWAWEWDSDGTHEAFAIDGDATFARFRQDLIPGAGYTVEWPFTGTGVLRTTPLRVRVATVVPSRIDARLVVPADFSSVYNVTDAAGHVQGRRYVGEPRFVPVVLNATTPASWRCLLSGACDDSKAEPKVVLVPRSVFYDTRLYDKLSRQDLGGLPSGLSFRKNDTSAAWNSDGLQEILAGNVTSSQYYDLLDLLTRNATGSPAYTTLNLTNDLFLYSLPDEAVRLVAYKPLASTPSVLYTFCSGSCGTVSKPVWERIWEGLVATVTSWIASAIVFAAYAFVRIAEVLLQVGSWFAQVVSQAAAAVASAVEAAAKVVEQVVDWIIDAVVGLVNAFLDSLVSPLIGAFQNLLAATSLMAVTVQRPGQGTARSPEFVIAYDGFVLALADLLLLISTFQLLLLGVDIGLTALSFTGFGSLIAVAAEVAVTVAFALVASQLVATIETIFLDVLVPALAFSALVLAVLGAFVAVTSALTPQWTETTRTVVRNDFRGVYGDLVDQVKIKPVITRETQRVYSQTAGSGTAILLAVVAMAIASLQLALLASTADPMTKVITALVIDVVATAFGVWAVVDAAKIPPITSMSRWSKALAPVALGVSVALFGADLLKYRELAG